MNSRNDVINDFGDEWGFFKQTNKKELKRVFNQYFHIFPWDLINEKSTGFDMGCGSGRWAQFVASKVGTLNCIEPSKSAIKVAMENLKYHKNCEFKCSTISQTNLKDNSQDFGYCLGVLHHVENTLDDLKRCTSLLKKGSPFLLYLYYKFDNRPIWFKFIALTVNKFRQIISKFPFAIKLPICILIGILIYFPLAKLTWFLETINLNTKNIPLRDYKNKSIYYMLTDALDRFGTKLEKRYTKEEIIIMMKESNLEKISFSDREPFWVALGYKS